MLEKIKKLEGIQLTGFMIATVLIVGLFVFYIGPAVTMDHGFKEYEQIAPKENFKATDKEAEKKRLYIKGVNLNFGTALKTRISFGKYGFIKKEVFDKPTVIYQHAGASYSKDYVYFGIYKDEKLTDPVREISVEEANDLYSAAAIADENGEEIPNIPWDCDNILTVLEPGTYYFGVYSPRAGFDSEVYYECIKTTIEEEIELEEGKWGFVAAGGSKYSTYCKINIDKPEKICLERDFEDIHFNVLLCDENKKPIEWLPENQKKYDSKKKAIFNIKTPGTYYFKMTYSNEDPWYYYYEIRYREVE